MKSVEKVSSKIPLIQLTWSQILLLACVLGLYHAILILFAFGMLIGAYKTHYAIGSFIDLISSKADGTILTMLLLVAGLLCFCFSSIAVYLLLKSVKNVADQRINKMLFYHVIATGGLILILFCIAIAVISHSYGLHEGMQDGIVAAMKQYGVDTEKKVIIDRLQIKFQCCGSNSYKEWFEIEWYDPLVGGAPHSTENSIVTDNTPFSCCLIGVLFPCVHHHLTNRSDIYTEPKGRTFSISTEGCRHVIKEETTYVGWFILLTLLGMCLLEFLGGIGMRIIQTAHKKKFRFERNDYVHTAWLYKRKKKSPNEKVPSKEESQKKMESVM